MAPIPLLVFLFLITHSMLPSSAEEKGFLPKCPPVLCGNDDQNEFSFNNTMSPECGELKVKCSEDRPKIQFKPEGHWYTIERITQLDSKISIVVKEKAVPFPPDSNERCQHINEHSLPSPTDSSHFSSYNYTADNLSTLYNCGRNLCVTTKDFDETNCTEYDLHCNLPHGQQRCPNITLPFSFSLSPPPPNHFTFKVQISPACLGCHMEGGNCHDFHDEDQFRCILPHKGQKKKLSLGLGLGFGLGVLLTVIGLAIILWRRKQKRQKGSASRNMADPYMNMEDPWGPSSDYLGVFVFSYKELNEATNNFDPEKKLGDGGFGTVYHGKLKDGREVAVKRLYEHNYKRVEQFINEIKILTRLRHKNLVSLYGCTSRRCQELLLVYEYIPNGTVADHLHGNRAKTSPLIWPIRLSIAIETASALAYLHASDVVHRDVKTNNILLDNNFCVKVADFGLSRLFPNDVTHVSTAPQGTPGYVDPEYHQCYQLTSKSDVYSFGVVLVELLSSMPAVDTTRHKREINLSNLAICKIQKRAYNELIDQGLGFDSDTEVRTMTIAVAELAFECLQQDKEMRPTMDEVLGRLRRIKDGKIETHVFGDFELNMSIVHLPPPPSPDCDKVGLLEKIKHEQPPSPNAVTENWSSSKSTTPNFSG